ncbi:MAG: transglutaminase family protein, partial [Anaerolineae bacterium]
LARAAGLPARLAVGYLGGDYDPQTRTYTLHGDDAHSWPEVYFPGYGWIPFEPTAGRPALERPETPPILPPAPSEAVPLPVRWMQIPSANRIGLVLLLGIVVVGIVQWVQGERLKRLPPRRVVLRLWGKASRWAARGTDSLPAGATPLETARHLKGSLAPLRALPGGVRLYADAVQSLAYLLHQVHLAWFAPTPPKNPAQVWHHWKRLRRRMWLSHLAAWLQQHLLRS